MNRRDMIKTTAASALLPTVLHSQDDVSALAAQAYVYLYPIVQNYLSIYQWGIDAANSQYKGPFNQVNNVARVFTPADTGVITPNSDTPYSYLIMDLRAEPIVVTLPAIEKDRYYSLQLVDLYTHNVDYLGTRTDGNGGGAFLIVGPDWEGTVPPGIRRVVRMPTAIAFSQFRTQLFSPADIENVKKIQAGYRAEPLSAHLGQEAPPAAPATGWPPITPESMATNFWPIADFLLQFAPPMPWETDLRRRFTRLGLGGDTPWPPADPAVAAAMQAATAAGLAQLQADAMKLTTSAGLFGTPEEMRGKYRERALGALAGIYGNSVEEALYPSYLLDARGAVLDGSKNRYVFRFTKDNLPPVKAFWSVTMYDGVTRFLVENPIDRYLINSAMLSDLIEEDGQIVIYMQHDDPGEALRPNWLPAPDGLMGVVLRLYLPEPQALDGRWSPPEIEMVG